MYTYIDRHRVTSYQTPYSRYRVVKLWEWVLWYFSSCMWVTEYRKYNGTCFILSCFSVFDSIWDAFNKGVAPWTGLATKHMMHWHHERMLLYCSQCGENLISWRTQLTHRIQTFVILNPKMCEFCAQSFYTFHERVVQHGVVDFILD